MDASRAKVVRAQLPVAPSTTAHGSKLFGGAVESAGGPAPFLSVLTGLSGSADTAPAPVQPSGFVGADRAFPGEKVGGAVPLLDAAALLSSLGVSRNFSEAPRGVGSEQAPASVSRDSPADHGGMNDSGLLGRDTPGQGVPPVLSSCLGNTAMTPSVTGSHIPPGKGVKGASVASGGREDADGLSRVSTSVGVPPISGALAAAGPSAPVSLSDHLPAIGDAQVPIPARWPGVTPPPKPAQALDARGLGDSADPVVGGVATVGAGALSLNSETLTSANTTEVVLPGVFSEGLPALRNMSTSAAGDDVQSPSAEILSEGRAIKPAAVLDAIEVPDRAGSVVGATVTAAPGSGNDVQATFQTAAIALSAGLAVVSPAPLDGETRVFANVAEPPSSPAALAVPVLPKSAGPFTGSDSGPVGEYAIQSHGSGDVQQAAADVAANSQVDASDEGAPSLPDGGEESPPAVDSSGLAVSNEQPVFDGALVAVDANVARAVGSDLQALPGMSLQAQAAGAMGLTAPQSGARPHALGGPVVSSAAPGVDGPGTTSHGGTAIGHGDLVSAKLVATAPVVGDAFLQGFQPGSARASSGLVAETASMDSSADVRARSGGNPSAPSGRSSGRQSSIGGHRTDPTSQGFGSAFAGTDKPSGQVAGAMQPIAAPVVSVPGIAIAPLTSDRGVFRSDEMGNGLPDGFLTPADVPGAVLDKSSNTTASVLERGLGESARWDATDISLEREPFSGPKASESGGHVTTEERVAEQVTYWINQETQNAELTVTRDGTPVEVSVSLSGNEAHITFRTDQEQTRDLLDQSKGQLSELLRAEGLVLSGVAVGTSAGQSASDGGQGEEAKRRRENARQVQLSIATPNAGAAALAGRVSSDSVDVFV